MQQLASAAADGSGAAARASKCAIEACLSSGPTCFNHILCCAVVGTGAAAPGSAAPDVWHRTNVRLSMMGEVSWKLHPFAGPVTHVGVWQGGYASVWFPGGKMKVIPAESGLKMNVQDYPSRSDEGSLRKEQEREDSAHFEDVDGYRSRCC